MINENGATRRSFLKKTVVSGTGAALGLNAIGAPAIRSAFGAAGKIRMGFIGLGNRGTGLLNRFMKNDDVEVVALCDVYEPYLLRDSSKIDKRFLATGKVPKMDVQFNSRVARYKDFRDLLANKDVDGVCIGTPDHWHAVQTIMALEAGKDIYVEKPLTITIYEGRKMVEAAKKTDRVVQVGLNRRGSSVYQQLARLVRGGKIGKVTIARAFRINNMYPNGIGNAGAEKPPKGLDWDLWLGPRAYRPFQYNIVPYKFRWWKSYSSQMGNWGVHYLDVIRWLMGEEAPVAITAHGGKYVLKDDRTIPDTMEVTFEFASGAIAVFGMYEANGGDMVDDGEIEFRGTKANLYSSQSGYKIVPTKGGQFQNRDTLTEFEEKRLEEKEDSTANLIRNFLDCVKSRQRPLCGLEEGHRSTSFALLANISLEMETRIEWDAQKEQITNNKDANKLLHYEYRKPWTLG